MNMLITPIAIQQVGMSGSLDTELLQLATSEGLKIGHLEDNKHQFAVLEAITTVNQLDNALSSTDNLIQKSVDELKSLFACYSASDINCLAEKTGPAGEFEPWQYELLMAQRNRTLVPVIDNALESEKAFIAVGAGHLVGEDSVLKMLEAEGYSIERMKF